MAPRASSSTRSFSGSPVWPRTLCQTTSWRRVSRAFRPERSGGLLPVKVAAAALADHEVLRRLQLLDRLRPDPDAAAAADRGAVHRDDRDPAARPEDLVVVGQQRAGQLAGARVALAAHDGQLLLDLGQLLPDDGLVLLALRLTPLELRLGLPDVHGELLLELHEGQDLLLALALILLFCLDFV